MNTGDKAVTIEEIIRQRTREITDTGKYHSREIFTRDSTLRKIKAAEYFAPVLKEKFGEKYPSLDWNAVTAEICVLIDTSPDDVARDTKYINALAIFILDSVLYGEDGIERYEELKDLMPGDVFGKIVDEDAFRYFESNMYIDGNHPLHPDDLITDLMTLITFRNCDYVDYAKEKSGMRRYAFIADSYTTEMEKPVKYREGETREIYEKVVSLVGKEFIDEAVDAYSTLFFELISLWLECREKMEKQAAKLEGQLEYLEMQMKEEGYRIFKEADPLSTDEALFRKFQDLLKRKELFELSRDFFAEHYTLGNLASPEFTDRYTDMFLSASVPDPYKVIAGFFFLFEEGDDRAWLMGPATATLGYAANLLPWADNEWDIEKEEDDALKLRGNYGFPDSFYRPSLNLDDLGFYEDDEKSFLSPAKFVYSLSRGIIPRYMVKLPYREKLFSFLSDEDVRKLELMYTYSLRHSDFSYQNNSLWKMLESYRNEVSSMKKELDETKKSLSDAEKGKKSPVAKQNPDEEKERENRLLSLEIERLKCALSEKAGELEKERKERVKDGYRHKKEEEELYSLRELIFSTRNEEKESEAEKETSSRSWPYRTKANIVLVGGHPDWINKMKALLPDVRFYGDRVPPKEVLKNTDVLWIQTKICLSHSTFYKLVDQAKNLDLPIRYLLNFGIYTSAEAVAALDEKSDR